jgi:DNA-binding MarR family transcriptional regulator
MTEIPDDDARNELPLTPAVFHILLALADGEKHGYAIMQEVETVTAGQVTMGPGTLYGSIKRMLKASLIVETDERPDPALDDARRRYYELTAYGRAALPAGAVRGAGAGRPAPPKQVFGGSAPEAGGAA